MKRLYIVRVEWSQTDHQWLGVWAKDRTVAQDIIKQRCPGAYYYSIAAVVEKVIE